MVEDVNVPVGSNKRVDELESPPGEESPAVEDGGEELGTDGLAPIEDMFDPPVGHHTTHQGTRIPLS